MRWLGTPGTLLLFLMLAGAVASWVFGAIHYTRSLRSLRPGASWISAAAWPFATKRIAGAPEADRAPVNKALVALIVFLTLGVTTISLATNLNRLSK
ncbi:MAG: hypothetical protein QOD74_964 [Variibacter sp.]|nr:hypothetical protein [Variibacter sp.]